jgi:replication-associated recombination protein RarA
MPEKVANRSFYKPTDRGFEQEIRKRMKPWKKEKE